MSSYISHKARKEENSAIHGRGLFAIEKIFKDEIVTIKGGAILTSEQLKMCKLELHVQMQIADDLFIAPKDVNDFEASMMCLNHSCDGNLGIMGNIIFVAIRDIDIGEEITVDYALMDNNSNSNFICQCGQSVCRNKVTGLDWQLPDLQQKYMGYFATHIARLISKI